MIDFNEVMVINEVFKNSSYSEGAKRISQRFHDQLNTPMEKAIHWVEHVAKHKGSLYMQSSGVHLPFHIYYNLDVWAFIISVFGFMSYILFKLFQTLWLGNGKRTSVKQKSH